MEALLLMAVLVFSFVVHEWAHAWVAYKQGDPTAAELGRLTLNPIPHLDLFGSILIPAMLIASGSGILIGWAKPVPVVASNFRNYRRGDILVSLAGVTANLILAVLFTLLMIGFVHVSRAVGPAAWQGPVDTLLGAGISLNLLLMVFNLIPVPPLDGSRLVYHLLPPGLGQWYRSVEKWGILVFVALLLTGWIAVLLRPAVFLERLSFDFIQRMT